VTLTIDTYEGLIGVEEEDIAYIDRPPPLRYADTGDDIILYGEDATRITLKDGQVLWTKGSRSWWERGGEKAFFTYLERDSEAKAAKREWMRRCEGEF
jgi:hypothetical protein